MRQNIFDLAGSQNQFLNRGEELWAAFLSFSTQFDLAVVDAFFIIDTIKKDLHSPKESLSR